MKNDLVSVIIPTFNRFEYLQDAIRSVKSQQYDNLEIIVINDGSDQKEYYEEKFPDDIKIINLKENQKKINGFSSDSIRNIGVKEAQGKYLAFLDDDDIWMKGKLEIQIEKMKDTNCKISSTDGFFGNGRFNESVNYELYNKEKFYKKIKKKYKRTKYFKKGDFPEIWDKDFIEIHNCIILSSVIVEKDLFNLYGGFNGLKNGISDYDCWKGLLTLTNLSYVDEPLFYYDGNHGDGRNY